MIHVGEARRLNPVGGLPSLEEFLAGTLTDSSLEQLAARLVKS
jgi:hypothetical protein